MTRRTLLYLVLPPVLLLLWSVIYLRWGEALQRRSGAQVEIRPATVVETIEPGLPPKREAPIEPAAPSQKAEEPTEASPWAEARRHWMDSMAAEREEMIRRAFREVEDLEKQQGGRPVPELVKPVR